MCLCCTLRLSGILPMPNKISVTEVTKLLGKGEIQMIGTATCGILVMNIFILKMVSNITSHNWIRWILGFFAAFLGTTFILSIVGSAIIGVSVDQLFFNACCALMAFLGMALGLTYKEICVIGNIYLQSGICLFTAVLLAITVWRRWISDRTIINASLLALSLGYALLYLAVFCKILAYYPPPLDKAFDKCYHDLIRWAGEYGTTYNNVNYAIFIIGFLIPILLNLCLTKLFGNNKSQKDNACNEGINITDQ